MQDHRPLQPLRFRPLRAAARRRPEDLLSEHDDATFRRFLARLLAAQAAETHRSQAPTQDAPPDRSPLSFPGQDAGRLRLVS